MTDHGLDLAVIGNGRTAALVDPEGRLVWWCYPRFDSDPIFCRAASRATRRRDSTTSCSTEWSTINRNICATRRSSRPSYRSARRRRAHHRLCSALRQFGRVFRPPQLIRIIEPIAGLPRITIRFRPTHHYGRPFATSFGRQQPYPLPARGHRSSGSPATHRSPTSSARPVRARPARCTSSSASTSRSRATWRPPVANSATARIDYWLDWSRGLSISYDWQDEIIRAAITLKLSNFRGDRRHHRRPHHLDPGSARLRAQLGLPLLLAARCLFRGQGAQPASAPRRRWRTSSRSR